MKNILITLILLSPCLTYGENYLVLSKKIAKLRTEVEAQNQEVNLEKKDKSEKLRGYTIQKAELEASISKEEIKKKQLIEKINRLKKELNTTSTQNVDLAPLIEKNIAHLEDYINKSLPFKRASRLQNLSEIKKELAAKTISSFQGLSRLWSAIEDERRLKRENQLAKEQVVVTGKRYQAQLLKIGDIALFFKLEDGRIGRVIKQNNGWQNLIEENEGNIIAIRKLYDGFKKNIKMGEYEVPLSVSL